MSRTSTGEGDQDLSESKGSVLFVHAGAEMYGADRILLELVAVVIENGFRAVVVLPFDGELVAQLRMRGAVVEIFNIGVLRRKYFTVCGLGNRARLIFRAVLRLRAISKRERVVLVHSNTSVVWAGALVAKLMGLPHVWHVHEITKRPRILGRVLAAVIPRLSTRVVAVSGAVLAQLVDYDERNRANGVVIHNGIDGERIRNCVDRGFRAEVGVAEGQVLVGMIGRVNAWKGQGAFLDAAERIAACRPEVRFVLVGGCFRGDEEWWRSVRGRIESSSLVKTVTMLDFRDDVPGVLAGLDVFVLPSTQPDPFPTVVLEAMYAGLPVVGFAHGGVTEMIEDGVSGILVPPCDPAALASAVERLIEDPSLRKAMGEAARCQVEARFSRGAFARQFVNLYEELLRPPPSPRPPKTSQNERIGQ